MSAIVLECNGCGKQGTGSADVECGVNALPAGWLHVREGLEDATMEHSFYCSHNCLRTVENDD